MDLSLLNTSEASGDSADNGWITTLLLFLLLISALIWLVLSFTQRRTVSCKGYCWGLPGTVSAVNFLNPQHRFIYALAFGAFTTQFLNLLFFGIQSEFLSFGNEYIDAFIHSIYTVAIVLVIALLCYPIFACVEAPLPLVGYILGALYCDLYVAFVVYQMVVSSQLNHTFAVIALASAVPQLLCLSIVLVWYHFKAVMEGIRVFSLGKLALFEKSEQHLHEDYVRNLLRGRKQPVGIHHLVFSTGKGFRYPFPFLIAMVVVSLMMFQLTVQAVAVLSYIFSTWADSSDANGDPDEAALFRKMIAVGVIMPIAAAVLVYGLFFHLAFTMRKRMRALWTGKTDYDINIHQINNPSFTLASAMRYTGVQIASAIFAWVFYTTLFCLIGVFFVIFSYYPHEIGYWIYLLFVVSLWTAGILCAQVLIVKFFFISKQSYATKSIIISNRRAFNCFEYVVLLYNITAGMMFNLLRLLLSILITAVVILRLDRSLMLHGFEVTDTGLRLYKNFVTVETLFNNPVVHTFINILKNRDAHRASGPTTIADQSGFGYQSINMFAGVTEERYSRRAFNRWMVAYTLIKNRSLIPLRARKITPTHYYAPTQTAEKDQDEECFYVSISDTDMQKFAC